MDSVSSTNVPGNNKQLDAKQLIDKQANHLSKFENAVSSGNFLAIHHDHYDWWMFPIDERSSRGLTYTVFQGDIDALKQNPDFIKNYRRGIYLLFFSWGWDLHKNSSVENPAKGQAWQMYPIRFFKAAKSALLFSEKDYVSSMKSFAEFLGQKNLEGEDGFRTRKILGIKGTENTPMPPPRYGAI